MRMHPITFACSIGLMGLLAPGAPARQAEAARKAVVEAVIERSEATKAELPAVLYAGTFDGRKPQVAWNNWVLASEWAQPTPRQCTACHAGAVGNLAAAPKDAHHAWLVNAATAAFQTIEARALGLTLGKLAEPLRVQLRVPADRGVILSALEPGGPAMAAGLLAGDILLSLDGQPLAAEADLAARLAALGSKPAPLAILRGGKPQSITVGGRPLATFAPVETPKVPDYFVGLETRPVDDALRAHLPALPSGVGLLVEAPTPEGPAARAGVKPNDILLAAGGAPLPDVDALRAAIKAAAGKPLPFKLLRAGAETVVPVTPEPRKPTEQWAVDVTEHLDRLVLYRQLVDVAPTTFAANIILDADGKADPKAAQNVTSTPTAGLDKRLEALDAELKALRAAIDELRKSVGGK